MTPEESAAFGVALGAAAQRVEAALDTALPPIGPDAEGQLAAAMRRGALAGGKRLRAFLTLETAALFGAAPAGAARVAASVECLHAYSLVHDDLPAMDDDDLRRGLPTVHKEWDEATAILAGDALQTLAFELIADPATHPDGGIRAALTLAMARASGFHGMVGGQALDIAAESAGTAMTVDAIAALQAKKTGALIAYAAEAGALLGRASAKDQGHIRRYAEALGAAFQIADDILDVEGDAKAAGKRLGKDAAAGKATFVSLLGLEAAKRRATKLIESAEAELISFGEAAHALRHAARFAISRSV